MKESEMRKGRKVLISSTIATRNTHTTTNEMENMLNKSYKIDRISSTSHGRAAIIKGYYWHPKDLTLFKPAKLPPTEKPKPQHFDVKELMT